MSTPLERLHDEKQQNDENIEKLIAFMESSTFETISQKFINPTGGPKNPTSDYEGIQQNSRIQA
jgi:hypothetical protein